MTFFGNGKGERLGERTSCSESTGKFSVDTWYVAGTPSHQGRDIGFYVTEHVAATLGAVVLFRGVPADDIGWIVLADEDTEAAGST